MGTVHRFRLYFAWNFAREEAWINRLSREKGLQLRRVGFCHYEFEAGERGAYLYRLELLRRTARDEAEKHYLKTIGAEEVCRNGDWGYYRIPTANGPFSSYTCADSKLKYLEKIYKFYLFFGVMVYVALLMDLSAFLPLQMTPLRMVVLLLLLLLALGYTVELTRFHVVLRRLRGELGATLPKE
jgi:hypothetical protein